MLLGYGYITKKGLVFRTNFDLIRQGEVIAVPGDLINVEGNTVTNLSRVYRDEPNTVSSLDNIVLFDAGRRRPARVFALLNELDIAI